MFGQKSKKPAARLIHINFSAETFVDTQKNNMITVKEYCHITYEQDGFIQHAMCDANAVKWTVSDDALEPLVTVNNNFVSGQTRGAEIFLPSTGVYQL